MLRWAWRHRRAVAITSVVAGATAYGAYTFYKKKRELDELVDSLGLRELFSGEDPQVVRATREEKVREHFQATQREADRLLKEALPRLQEQIAQLLDTDGFKEKMRADGATADLQRWHELKVLVVSRLLTAQYALILTILAIRVRLNIVSRHFLLETQASASGERPQDGTLQRITKKRFLSIEPMLSEGLLPLERGVTACVRAHLASEAATAEALGKEALLATIFQEEALQMLVPMHAELELGVERTSAGGHAAHGHSASDATGNGNGTNGHPRRGSGSGDSHSGGAAASTASNGAKCLVGGFLASELASHGTVAEGDQLHPLLTEVREIVSSTPYQIALGDLLQASHVVVAEQLEAAWAPAAAGAVASGAAAGGISRAKLLAKLNTLATAVRCSGWTNPTAPGHCPTIPGRALGN